MEKKMTTSVEILCKGLPSKNLIEKSQLFYFLK